MMESFYIFLNFIVNLYVKYVYFEFLMIIYIRLFKMFYRYLGWELNFGYKEWFFKIKGLIEFLLIVEFLILVLVIILVIVKIIVDNVIKEELL